MKPPLLYVLCALFSLVQDSAGAPQPGEESTFQLPEIDSVMMKATDKVMDFAAQAAAMQARVAQKQAESKAAVAAMKRKYEQRLVKQSEVNRHMEEVNDMSRHKIHLAEERNQVLETEAKSVQQENLAMREILGNLADKVRAAKIFVADSLNITDDSHSEQLRVLLPSKPKPTLARFLAAATTAASVARRDKFKAAPSLLQTASEEAGAAGTEAPPTENTATAAVAAASAAAIETPEAPESRPEDLVSVLSSSLAELDDAERAGEMELQSNFEAAYDQGSQQFEALSEIQKEINTTKAALVKRRQELKAARAHLIQTREQLKQRLRGVKVFSDKVIVAVQEALKRVPVREHSRPSHATESANATQRLGLLELTARGGLDQVPPQKHMARQGDQRSRSWFWSR